MSANNCGRTWKSPARSRLLERDRREGPKSRVFAIGHFGNFELFASATAIAPAYQAATTYRGLKGEAVNRLLLEVREKTGCLFFERRTEGAALRAALRNQLLLLGLLSDQHAGDHGVRLPFLGTIAAPARRRRFLRCVSICRCTRRFVSAPAWDIGGSRWAMKFRRLNKAGRVRSKPSCWTSTGRSRPRSAAIPPTGFGSINAGNPRKPNPQRPEPGGPDAGAAEHEPLGKT